MANTCKYQKLQRYVSYDSGATWQPMEEYQRGALIEADSQDCGAPPILYRWTEMPSGTSYVCVGYNKYTEEKRQQSTDGGTTWMDVIPLETRTGSTIIEYNSEDCGYVPPQPTGNTKWVAYYDDGIIESASCSSDNYVRSGEVKSYVVTESGRKYIRSIAIGDCPHSIGDEAFASFETLSLVRIGSGVTRIWDSAFRGCDALTSIGATGSGAALEIPSGVTTLYNQVFAGCESLTSVTIPNTVLYFPDNWGRGPACEMFAACSALTQVNLPNTITKLGDEMFRGCYSLPSIVIPDSVTEIGHWTFFNCTALTSVTLPNGLLTIDDSFINCGLTAITIPNTVTTIGGAFQSCRSLSSVTIPDSVTSLGALAFQDCSGLTSVTIGSGITSIGRGAFSGCSSLTSITINATTPPTLTTPYADTFADTNDCPIMVPCDSLSAYQSEWSIYASRIVGIPPCSEIQYRWYQSGTTCIGYDKYQNNIKQQSTDGGQTWENVSPPEYSASTVIEHNSEDCGYVPTPPVPSGTKWVATYSDSHTESAQCDSSSATTYGEIANTEEKITTLESVVIGSCVTSIGEGSFTRCSSMTEVTIGSNVTSIGNNAFHYCYNLTDLTIGSAVTTIGGNAFRSCNSLTSVTIPNSVTSIGHDAFYLDSALTSITIGNSVISIGNSAFHYCSGLTEVTIPSSVTSIGDYAFYRCYSLTSITCLATTPPSLSIYGPFSDTNNCPIMVPAQSVSAYKSASGWSKYASRIQPIPNS